VQTKREKQNCAVNIGCRNRLTQPLLTEQILQSMLEIADATFSQIKAEYILGIFLPILHFRKLSEVSLLTAKC